MGATGHPDIFIPVDDLGNQVLTIAVDRAKSLAGERLRAAYAIGSLAHGGFAPESSDVDLALIFDRADETAGTLVGELTLQVHARCAGTELESLAGRLSVFWSDWESLQSKGSARGRFPAVDRLDFFEFGRVIFCTEELRASCRRPTKDEVLIDSSEFAIAKMSTSAVGKFGPQSYIDTLSDPAGLARAGGREVSKAVLFPVRLEYTCATGRLGQNEDAANWYLGQQRSVATRVLVERAMHWRHHGIDNEEDAEDLLRDGLIALYLEFAEAMARELSRLDRPDLTKQLKALATRLSVQGWTNREKSH